MGKDMKIFLKWGPTSGDWRLGVACYYLNWLFPSNKQDPSFWWCVPPPLTSRFSCSCPKIGSPAAFLSSLFTKCQLKIAAHHLIADLTLGCSYLWVSMKSSLLSGLLFLMFTPGRKPWLLFPLKGDCKGENELVPVVALWCISGKPKRGGKKGKSLNSKGAFAHFNIGSCGRVILLLSLSRTLRKMEVWVTNNNLQGILLNDREFICGVGCRGPAPRRNPTELWKCCLTNYPLADRKFLFFLLQATMEARLKSVSWTVSSAFPRAQGHELWLFWC